MHHGFTKVPSIVFDNYLPQTTSLAEMKILLVIIRQTMGWKNIKTGKRKIKDRISHNLFIHKTGLSRKVISKSIHSLVSKGLITVFDYRGNVLDTPQKRKGKSMLFYSFSGIQLMHFKASTYAQSTIRPMHKRTYNKRNHIKEIETKETVKSIEDIIRLYQSKYLKN